MGTAGWHTHIHRHTTPNEKLVYNRDTWEPCKAWDSWLFKGGSFSHLSAEESTKKQTRYKIKLTVLQCTLSLHCLVLKKEEESVKYTSQGREKVTAHVATCSLWVQLHVWEGLTFMSNRMVGQRPTADLGKRCPLYTWGSRHKERCTEVCMWVTGGYSHHH